MEKNHKLALYVAYYLSRFDLIAYNNLGFKNRNQAHRELSEVLNVKPATLKNMRDEFDPIHEHRAGWYQRPMGPSRVAVVEALEEMDESDVNQIINLILERINKGLDSNIENLTRILSDNNENKNTKLYTTRGITGKKAEEIFIEYFKKHQKPVEGKLIDCRDIGCGYDFEIKGESTCFVEVKGNKDKSGGIMFTSKEWKQANQCGENYYLALITDVSKKNPEVKFIKNPASTLNPQKQVTTVLQIRWTLNDKELLDRLG